MDKFRPKWTVSGGFAFHEFLLDDDRKTKQYLDINQSLVDSVYDSIFGLKWNGGRICSPKKSVSIAAADNIIRAYNDQYIGFNFTFTNLLLTKEDLNDDYCNLILERLSENPRNGVIVASDTLMNYIKTQYPNLRLILSVTANPSLTAEEYNKICEKGDVERIVLHPDFNHNPAFLDQLKYPKKIEVMANDKCIFGCPYRREHYLDLSKKTLAQASNPIIHTRYDLDGTATSPFDVGDPSCHMLRAGYDRDGRNILTQADMDMFRERGFEHFKLIGREYSLDAYKEEYDVFVKRYFMRNLVKHAGVNIHI